MPLWRMLKRDETSRAESDKKYEALIDDLVSEKNASVAA
jgi:hypothetical protein